MSEIKCPFCNSTQITSSQKGFSVGKAAVGAAMVGGPGLLAGMIGKNKVIVTCLNCGKQWEAGAYKEETVAPILTEEENKLKQAEFEANIKIAKLELEAMKNQAELKELEFIEKQKTEREKCLEENKLLTATIFAFTEAVAKLTRARKQYRFDKNALTISFDGIIGKELSTAISTILELDQTSTCYETLKQKTIELAVSEKSIYTAALKITETIDKIIPPVEESMHPKTIHFQCMKCGQKYDGDQSYIGQTIECATCGEKIKLVAYDFLNKK